MIYTKLFSDGPSCLRAISANLLQPVMISIQHPNEGYDKLNLGEGRTQADGGLNDIISNNVRISLYSAFDELDWKFC